MRLYPVALLCLFLSGCAGGSVSAPPAVQAAAPPALDVVKPVKLTPTEIAAVHKGMRASLKDPDSVRFGKIIAGTDSKGETTVCLMVNAKNSYGGYTGEKPFMGILTDKAPKRFIVAGGVPDHLIQHRDEAVYKVCSDQGLPLP